MLDDLDGLPLDLPPEAEAALTAVGPLWEDEPAAERMVLSALAIAPRALAARLAAYKFYFYRHRLDQALPHARACLEFAATALGLPDDWRRVPQDHPALAAGLSPLPKLWLQCLTAIGYLEARLGRLEEAQACFDAVGRFDTADRSGARRLKAVVLRGGRDDED